MGNHAAHVSGSGPAVPATVVRESALGLAVIWIGFPVGAGAVALLLTTGGDWLRAIPFLPWFMNIVTDRLTAFAEWVPGDVPAAVTVSATGAVLGLVFSAYTHHQSATVTVADDHVRLTQGSTSASADRTTISTVFVHDDHLVAVDRRGQEVLRGPCDLDTDELATAFRERGYHWSDEDPHADAYRLWVPGLPQLPEGSDALFTARQAALDDDKDDEAEALRAELARLGVVVRDQDGRQHWRLSQPPG